MFNYGFELAVNFAQSVYLIGFFLAFLGGKYSRKRNIAMCSLFIALNFTVLTYFTFNNPYVVMIDMLTVVILHEVYCLTCLKGELAIKIILPFVASLINTIISYGVLYLTSFVTGLSLEELGLQSSFFRYLCVVLVNLTILVTLLLMWRTKAKVYSLKKVSNIIAFIAIPVLAMAILYITFYIMILTNYQSNLIILLLIICAAMILVAGMVWFMIARINRDNRISTKLLLSEQRADLYEKNIITSNKQIENTAKIRHDMKNNIACIDNLIVESKYDEAHKICQELTDKYSSIGSVVNTENYLLNAVLNVEIEKARCNEISVKLSIANDMKMFSNGSDMISVIGNIFDNAISYLSENKIENKEIIFSTEHKGDYSVIKCKNKIIDSVLSKNPLLHTDKADKKNHGKGISIVKSIAQKYGGDVVISEKNNEFIVSVFLPKNSLFLPD